MKLYEINAEIQRLADQIVVDEETGEILTRDAAAEEQAVENIMSQLDSLHLEKQSVLQYLAKLVLNLRSEESALKAEEIRLKARREHLEKKEERLMNVLDRECAGQRTELGVATLAYRKTSRVDVSDSKKAIRWLKRNKHTECFRVPEPEVAKTEVKKLLTAGVKVPGCALTEGTSCSLK